ncbi:hypothetical protein PWT90_03386 [Aphanocladium album]|nr:hypothetical protein PWT90_03386 [Aphanocladium album]
MRAEDHGTLKRAAIYTWRQHPESKRQHSAIEHCRSIKAPAPADHITKDAAQNQLQPEADYWPPPMAEKAALRLRGRLLAGKLRDMMPTALGRHSDAATPAMVRSAISCPGVAARPDPTAAGSLHPGADVAHPSASKASVTGAAEQ